MRWRLISRRPFGLMRPTVARAAIKHDINSQLRPADLSMFKVPGLTAELREGMGAFVEKRPVDWPRQQD